MDLVIEIVSFLFKYLPLIAGAYITISLLKVPDLTIESNWSVSAIVACMFVNVVPAYIAPLIGLLIGALSGVLTGVIFMIIGRKKLLATLISFTIQIAIGYHLLGNNANVYSASNNIRFGLTSETSSIIYYGIFSLACLLAVFYIDKSKVGIIQRLIGENPYSSLFYKIKVSKVFLIGFIISGSIIGFGGALWGVYYGYASNTQGIGLVFTTFLALLLGDEISRYLKIAKRSSIYSIIIGTLIFVLLNQFNEWMINTLQLNNISVKSSDKNFIMAVILMIIISLRRSKTENKEIVSQW